MTEPTLSELLAGLRQRNIGKMAAMIEAIEVALAKEREADEAFDAYMNHRDSTRSRASLAASARNLSRAADRLNGDAWRALDLLNLPEDIRQPIWDRGSQLDDYLEGLRDEHDKLVTEHERLAAL